MLIGVVAIIRHDGLVDTTQDVNNLLVLKYLHELHDLALVIGSFVSLANSLVQWDDVGLDELVHCLTHALLALEIGYLRKGFDKDVEAHLVQVLDILSSVGILLELVKGALDP